MRQPMSVGRRSHRLPTTLAALTLALLTACGGTSAGTTSAANDAATTASVVARISAPLATTSAAAATTTTAISAPSRTVSSGATAVTTVPLAAALSAASRLATSTATGSAGGGPVTVNLVFTGDVAGTMTRSPAPKLCGKLDRDILGTIHHLLGFGTLTAKLGDASYSLSLTVDPYKGPGTYDTTILTLSKDGTHTVYFSGDKQVVVVAPDEVSGTVEADFQDPLASGKGHVSGSWRCR